MKRKIRITVRREHVKNGLRRSVTSCPIALAIKESLFTDSVEVGEDSMTVNGLVYENTSAERKFIQRFDNGLVSIGKRYKSFKFFLELDQ